MRTLLASLILLLQGGGSEEASRLEQEAADRIHEEPGEAASLLRRALLLREEQRPVDRSDVARTLNSLSYALSLAGNHDEALATGERALDLARAERDPSPMTAAVRRNLAGAAERAGRLELALRHAEGAAYDLQSSYGVNPTVGEFREYAGQLALRAGDRGEAMEHLVQALGIYEHFFRSSAPDRLCGPMQGLAMVFAEEGWFDAALDLHDRALRLLERSGKRGTRLWSSHLARRRALLVELGELQLARADLRRWIRAVAPEVPPGQEVGARLDWTSAWLALGAPGPAREQLGRLSRTELRSGSAGRHLLLEAQCLGMEGSWKEARRRLEAARTAFAEEAPEGSRPVIAELEWWNARTLRAIGEPEAAVEALAQFFRLERDAWGEDAPRLTPTLLELLAAELPAHGVGAELIDLVELAGSAADNALPGELAALQNNSWAAWQRSAWDPLVRGWLHCASERPDRRAAAFAALDRSRERSLLSANAWWIERGAAHRDDALRDLLGHLRTRAGRPIEPEARARWRQERGAKLAVLRRGDNPWTAYLDSEGVDLRAVREALDEDRFLVSYHWTGPEVWALLVGPEPGTDRVSLLASTAELRPELEAALVALRDPAAAPELAAIAEKLLHPLWEELAGCASAVVLADGPLAFLPFEALPDPDGDPWVTTCNLSYVPTVRSWLRHEPDRRTGERGVVHLARSDPAENGAPRGSHMQRLEARIPPDMRSDPHAFDWQPAPDLVVATEAGLKAADREGELRGRRLLEVWAPTWVDAEVPSASAVVTSPGKQAEGLSLWEREDGVIGAIEWRDLTLDVGTAVLWRAEVVPHGAEVRHEGLHELVAALWSAGSRSVIVSGWRRPTEAAARFDEMLREELLRRETVTPLTTTQRRWLRENRDRPELLDPGIWARFRRFGR